MQDTTKLLWKHKEQKLNFKKGYKYLILRRTLDISSLFRLALLWVPNFLLATLRALLSLPTLRSSVILFS